SIKARLKEETRSFIQKRQVYYKEVFKIDGNLLGKKTHLVIDRLAQLNIALEHRSALVYDYRGLFLYENRKELCKLYTKQIEGLKDYIELRDKKHTYKAQITNKDKGKVYLHIHKEAEAKRALCFSYDEKDEHLITKAFKQTNLPLRYYKPTQYVIFINRHTQTPKYTLSDYQILKRQENGEYELVAQEN
ncbi:hypothetical protein, partial [Campylobacter troglodytis]|uniref:hypothetical protein n=1 Tax=Campylobacter troglodytis TaxID=654363 RepID=UPI00163D2418